jgi:hypothetical protein
MLLVHSILSPKCIVACRCIARGVCVGINSTNINGVYTARTSSVCTSRYRRVIQSRAAALHLVMQARRLLFRFVTPARHFESRLPLKSIQRRDFPALHCHPRRGKPIWHTGQKELRQRQSSFVQFRLSPKAAAEPLRTRRQHTPPSAAKKTDSQARTLSVHFRRPTAAEDLLQ